jgi:hypothetical protein
MKTIDRMFPQRLIELINVNLDYYLQSEDNNVPIFNEITNIIAGYYYDLDLKEMFENGGLRWIIK